MTNENVNTKELPPIGGIYAVPLPDGRWGACQVLDASNNISTKIKESINKKATIMVVGVALDIVSNDIPILEQVKKSKELNRDFLNWARLPGPVVVLTTDYFLNKEAGLTFLNSFPFLGVLDIPSSRKKLIVDAFYSVFEHFSYPIYAQWRWEHDKKAFLEEIEKEKLAKAKIIEENKLKQAQAKPRTIQVLLEKKRFSMWLGFIDNKIVNEVNSIFKKCIQQIIQLEKPVKNKQKALIKECIISINKLNEKEEFIYTSEAEDLFEELCEIVESIGIEDAEECIDQWRDW